MVDDARRSLRLNHPILRLEVLLPDGSRRETHRVFCRYRHRSVPAESCCGCVHCDAITGGPAPTIACTVPLDRPSDAEPDPSGDRTEVGAILREGTVALDPTSSLREALTLLHVQDRRSIAVVEASGRLAGVVHEVTFVKPGPGADVAAAMTRGLSLHEAVPVRRALRLLAGAHLREATVVDDAGAPIGVFRDVDGLRFLALARAR